MCKVLFLHKRCDDPSRVAEKDISVADTLHLRSHLRNENLQSIQKRLGILKRIKSVTKDEETWEA